jgi:hypothetical protein
MNTPHKIVILSERSESKDLRFPHTTTKPGAQA